MEKIITNNNNENDKSSYKYFWLIVIFTIVLVFGLWFWNWKALNDYPVDVRGTHGDMFGAVNAIFSGLAFAGIIISLYLQRIDLKNQFDEIRQTNEEFKIQNETLQVQKFENQYYKMIDLHRSNISDIEIPFFETISGSSKSHTGKGDMATSSTVIRELKGKKGFVDMAKELEFCIAETVSLLEKNNLNYNEPDIFEFAYKIFFWGVKSEFCNSEKIKRKDQNIVKRAFIQRQKQFKKNLKIDEKQDIKIRYVPFQGHESRLAHYYRHLFQTVKYVVQQAENELIGYEETRQYLRVLRAQLSNAEQLMLYYNYICGFGSEWDKNGKRGNQFLTRYRMIHNMPVNRIKYVQPPREHFAEYIRDFCTKENPLFEWGDYEN